MPQHEEGPKGKLAIIAGRDALPRLIAEARRDAALPYLVISFQGWTEDWMQDHPHELHEFEKVGRLFSALRREACSHVVFAGALERPSVRMWRADAKAMKLAHRVFSLMAGGDDGLLSGLAAIFEDEGFTVVGADECLGGLVAPPGVLGRYDPSAQDRADAARGAVILAALGSLDVGQAVVVAGGVCLGVEAVEGTDELLKRIAMLPAERRAATGGVLVKLTKSGQDRRVDMPTIGPRTIKAAAAAGLRGIASEAGGINILEQEETVQAADAAGLFLWCAAPKSLTG